MARKPRFYRKSEGNVFSWEIYDWHCYLLTFSLGRLEIQINKWPKQK